MTGPPMLPRPSGPGGEMPPRVQAPPTLRAGAGSPVTVELILTNRAALPRVLAVSAVGVDASWLPQPTRSRVLEPGESIALAFTLVPAPGTVAGQYPFAVAVQSLDPMTDVVTAPAAIEELTLVVDAPGQIALTLSPADADSVFGRKFQVVIQNTGPVTDRVTLESNTAEALQIELAVRQIDVPAGRSVPVSGRLKAGRARLFGNRIRHAYAITGHGTGQSRTVQGSYTNRPMLSPGAAKFAALLAVVSIWIAAGIVFIPKLADRAKQNDVVAAKQTQLESPPPSDGTDGGGAGGGGAGGGSGSGGSGSASAAEANRVQLNGTVSGNSPAGVTVAIEPVSPLAALDDASTGQRSDGAIVTPLGFTESMLTASGKITSDAVTASAPANAESRSTKTAEDGAWAIPSVPKPGYYLLSFSKPGLQMARYIIDSSADAAAQPLTVAMVTAKGTLRGKVTGPTDADGAIGDIGDATVTITDGINILSTSTNSKGAVGEWQIDGLSTPSAYVVTVNKDGLSTESELVSLAAGGEQRVDLTLRHGVASLIGRVWGLPNRGAAKGLGGATVTVSLGKVVRTATTVTDGDVAGSYVLPDLGPGTYTVTVSSPGYQPQTKQVVIAPGASRADYSPQLKLATGTLYGTISSGSGALGGAGLTLSNPTNAYKTTTASQETSDGQSLTPQGGYRFEGVEPGTYTLSTSRFGYAADTVTVEVVAGVLTSKNRTLGAVNTSVPASASITGQAVEAPGGGPIQCPVGQIQCIKATVTDPLPAGASGTTPQYSVMFAPNFQYTLPDPAADAGKGLLPGLHTVTLTAPGYETTQVQVSVPVAAAVSAPEARMYVAPTLSGTLTPDPDDDSTPTGHTCVWAAPASVSFMASSLTCDAADGCPASRPVGTYCTELDNGGVGFYELTLPSADTYHVAVQTSDTRYRTKEYSQSQPVPFAVGEQTITVEHGEAKVDEPPLHRFGDVKLAVGYPGGASGIDFTPVPDGTKVYALASCDTAQRPATLPTPAGQVRTDASAGDLAGTARITGRPDGPYFLYSTYTNSEGVERYGCKRVDVAQDKTASPTLWLDSPLGTTVGRVTYQFNGAQTALTNHAITVQATTGYLESSDSAALGTAVRKPFTLTTDADGCFALRVGSAAPVNTAECPNIASESVPFVVNATATPPKSTAVDVSLATSDGFRTDTQSLLISGDDVGLRVQVDPVPISFDGTDLITLSPAVSDVSAWNGLQMTVSSPDASATMTRAGAGSDASTSTIVWKDTTPASAASKGSNLVRPGTYTLNIGLPGYADKSVTFACAVNVNPCKPPQIALEREAGLTIAATDASGTAVNGPKITLKDTTSNTTIGTQIASATSNAVSFTGLTPGHAFSARIAAPGFAFGDDTYELSCTGGSLTSVAAGAAVSCTATLTEPLGSIKGTVSGVLALKSADVANPATSPIPGVIVNAWPCTSVTPAPDDLPAAGDHFCTSPVSGTAPFSTSAAPSTSSTPGAFTLTGTNSTEGLKPGWYAVSVQLLLGDTSYCPDRSTDSGTCDASLPTGASAHAVYVAGGTDADGLGIPTAYDPKLYQKPLPGFSVDATYGSSAKANGLSVTLTGDIDGSGNNTTLTLSAGTGSNTNRYSYAGDILPGGYTLNASGTNFSDANVPLNITNLTVQPYPLKMTRTLNQINGTITANQGSSPAGTATALQNAVVCVRMVTDAADDLPSASCGGSAAAAPSDSVTDLSSAKLWTKTDNTGGYLFQNITNSPPGARYYVQVEAPGYLTAISPPFVVTYPTPAGWTATLQRIVWPTTATVAINAGDTGAIGPYYSFVPASGTTAPTYSGLTPTPASGAYVVSAQLPVGCWKLVYAPPPDHFGTLSNPSGASPASASGQTCASGTFASPSTSPTSSASTLSVNYTLNEAGLDISAPVTALAPDTVPAVTIGAIRASGSDYTVPPATQDYSALIAAPVPAVSNTTITKRIWVRPGTYRATASTTAWGGIAHQTSGIVVANSQSSIPAANVSMIKEPYAELTVNITGATSSKHATVTVTCLQGQTSPADCATTGVTKTDAGSGSATFDQTALLAPGQWHVVATNSDGQSVEQDVTLTGGTTINLTMPSTSTEPTAFPAPSSPSPSPSSPSPAPSVSEPSSAPAPPPVSASP